MVAGHPFKGGWVSSIGQLQHPDIKRFQIATPYLFAPPNPMKIAGFAAGVSAVPSFSQFYSAYFAGQPYDFGDNACGRLMRGMKKCYETNQNNDPMSTCSYYIDGFKRMTCAQKQA